MTHPYLSKANQEKKQRMTNIRRDEINIMNIIKYKKFNRHNSFQIMTIVIWKFLWTLS